MFSSSHFVDDVNLIPSEWIFENYLGLPEPLTGQRVRIHSLFNPDDKTPSMYIYYNRDTKRYGFKCFSTGKSGGPIDLMMHMWKTDFISAREKIKTDYLEFLKTGKTVSDRVIEFYEWKVCETVTRQWNSLDAEFWLQFGIGSSLLKEYNVAPLDSYTMCKLDIDGKIVNQFEVSGQNIYGYFTKEGELYKIYQPKRKEKKFIKILDYMQGTDQLAGYDTLVITSSLKDIMTLKTMGLKVDAIAPHSENTIISDDLMKGYIEKYKSVVVYLDSDQAGIKAMQEYNSKYGIPFVYLALEKDISDVYKIHGEQKALYEFYPKLQHAIDKSLGIF
jgi:hypothetical protein